jgi:hypothetical protein
MKKILCTICIVIATAAAGFAAPIGNASLKGTYSFQLSGPEYESWFASISCPNPSGNGSYTLTGGGSDVGTKGVVGTIQFDGAGHAKGSYTEYGDFDQTLTNQTIQLSCTGPSDNGHAVYDAANSGTFTGTYAVESTGLGSMVLTTGGGTGPSFMLSLAGTAAVRTTVFLTEYGEPDNPTKVKKTGMAVLQ